MASKRKSPAPAKAAKAKAVKAVATAKKKAKAAPAKAAAKAKPAIARVTKAVKRAAKKVAPPAPVAKRASAPKKAPGRTRVREVAKAVTEVALNVAKAVTDAVSKPAKAVKKAVKKASSDEEEEGEGDRLDVGDLAPSFALPDEDGELVSSDSLVGKPYVIYFYPKDDTPGCTRQACGFRDDIGKFKSRGVDVIGVSPDSSSSHTKFIGKYGLNFPLLSDPEKSVAKAFGVWTKKKNYGREYMGIERSTFLVGKDGKVEKVWRSVKVDGHIGKVYDATEGLA